MLKAKCKHCQRDITYRQGDNGVWHEPTVSVQLGSQYCWMDPTHGSQLHQPDQDTIQDLNSN
jgi:hypothetical protein